MAILAAAVGNIVKNTYLLINPTDSWNFVKTYRTPQGQNPPVVWVADPLPTREKVVKGLVLGIIMAGAVLSTPKVLNVIDTHLKRADLKDRALGLVSFLHLLLTVGAAGNILKNSYLLINPTDSWNYVTTYHSAPQAPTPPVVRVPDPLPAKKEVVERLILGIIKVIAAFSIYTVLYMADTYLKRSDLKALASVCTFCVYPFATLDYNFFRGLHTMYNGLLYSAEGVNELKQIQNQALTQAQREGHYIPQNLKWLSPQARKRFDDIFKELFAKHDKTSIDTAFKTANEFYFYGGIRSAINGIGGVLFYEYCDRTKYSYSRLKQRLFWLDRKMVDVSKWVASHVV